MEQSDVQIVVLLAGRGRKKPVTKQQAMAELADVVSSIKPDKFEPKVVSQTDDYLYAEFQSPLFGVRPRCIALGSSLHVGWHSF